MQRVSHLLKLCNHLIADILLKLHQHHLNDCICTLTGIESIFCRIKISFVPVQQSVWDLLIVFKGVPGVDSLDKIRLTW